MAAKSRGYYGPLFKGYRRVTQGYTLSPMLFNVAVDFIIRHWVTVVAETEEVTEGLGLSLRDLAAYFYANDGLIVSTQPERMQREFNVLTGLFDRVVLRTNMRKTVSMAHQPCHAPGRMSVETYGRLTTGTGLIFWERQRMRVQCPECEVEVVTGSLLTHHQS